MKRLLKVGIGRVRRQVEGAGRWLRNKTARRAPILLYHRVAELPSDPQLLSVSPTNFAEQLEVLRRYAHPISLQEMVMALQAGDLPPRAVVITFDDGYADNLIHAKPLLKQYDTPATVFVTTGLLGQQREFWWDELERLLLQPNHLPQSLSLPVAGEERQWALGEAASYDEEAYSRHRGWHVLQKETPTARHALYRALHEQLFGLPTAEIEYCLQALQANAGVDSTARPTHCPLTAQEVIELAADGLVEVGAHTVTHPVLASLSDAGQRHEIERSKLDLEALLNRPVTSFSYPYGWHSIYTAQTVSLVREAGFGCACANYPDLVWQSRHPQYSVPFGYWARRHSDLYQLPRILVRDWDGDEFAKRLEPLLGRRD